MDKALTRFLGFFSLALGLAQLIAPGRVNELIGVEDDDDTQRWQRIVGAQEVSAFGGVMTWPAPFLWTRVAGDVLHLGLLARAWQTKRQDDTRLALAIGNVAGILVLDLYTATSRTRGDEGPTIVAMTIARPRPDVERAWREAGIDGRASFTEAPGGRGTELRVEIERAVRKPLAKDEVRRFKQKLEAGAVVSSDGTPEGQSTKRLFKQRPAQPVESA